MAEEDSGIIDSTCNTLEAALEKQAKQELGQEEHTPFLDTIDAGLGKDSTIEDLTDKLFNTESMNSAWAEAYGKNEGAEIRNRMGVAYFCAWKKALLKFYAGNDDIAAVFGLGLVNINIGAQSIEATRLVLSAPPSDTKA